MPDIKKTYEVKVVAEYWATVEVESGENLTNEQIEERAWNDFYAESYRASIEEVSIESEESECEECYETDVDESHICEEETGEESAE